MFTGLVEKVVQVEDFILTSNGAKITFDGDFDTKMILKNMRNLITGRNNTILQMKTRRKHINNSIKIVN